MNVPLPDPKDAARAILGINFTVDDRARMNELAKLASLGELTRDEVVEIEGYERIGHLLDIAHSKARRVLGD